MNLRIYNVGHGNATHIVTPAKQLVVVDLGASSDFSPLGEVADRTRKINKLILTHPHTDHLTEIGDIDGFSVDMLQRPKHLSEQAIRAGNQAKDKQVLDDYIAFSKRYSGTVAEDRKGWDVSSRSKGTSEHRFCLTTRSDGAIDIAVDRNSNGNPTLKVEIE